MTTITPQAPPVRRDRTHYLYLAVIAAVVAGIAVDMVWPSFAVEPRQHVGVPARDRP